MAGTRGEFSIAFFFIFYYELDHTQKYPKDQRPNRHRQFSQIRARILSALGLIISWRGVITGLIYSSSVLYLTLNY